MKSIETKRLVLREWKSEDVTPLIAINQDPKVMEYFLKPLTASETEAMVAKIQNHFGQHGFGLFACILKESDQCIGYVGLWIPDFQTHFTPCVEIGWRLASSTWGKGYATEAAKAVLKAAFEDYGLQEVVSFAVPMNKRSLRVMEKIGMQRNEKEDFDHPKIPVGHPLRRHVLYRITKEQWMDSRS